MTSHLIDISSFEYILPLLSFLVVLFVVFAVLVKTKLFDNAFLNVFISIFVALIFVSFVNARQYVTSIVPWAAVLIVCAFFLLLLTGFFGKDIAFLNKGFGVVFTVIFVLGLIVAAVVVFSPTTTPWLIHLTEQRWYGAIVLLIVTAIAAWVLTRK